MEQKSNINPQILQQMLESAPNAAEKGQSQFFTPFDTGQALAAPLPRSRRIILDLNCGAGNLLQASANKDTEYLLGSDIDSCKGMTNKEFVGPRIESITHDLTKLYPLLKEVGFKADLFVLNPPWRLWWHRDRIAGLADSELDAVREAFANMEESAARKGTVDGTTDSTIATLMMALDLCSYCGEGMLFANNATLERLIFTPGAPHAMLAKHIWAHVVIPGNPMTGIDDCLWEKDQQFHTGVIYFAPSHKSGPRKFLWPQMPDRTFRFGSSVQSRHDSNEFTVELWSAVQEKIGELNGKAPRNPYNLWLNVTGRIRTALSTFEDRSTKVDKREAGRMFQLEGKTPMELVLQRAQRDELMHVVEQGGWRVEPGLIAAVKSAVAEYHAARAPLYPLPDIQRLGYLDEQDTIECRKDLMGINPGATSPAVIFRKCHHYSIRTQTVEVTRHSTKFNPFTMGMDSVEHSGQELAIYIAEGILTTLNEKQTLNEYCFMDGKIKGDENTTVENSGKRQVGNDNTEIKIDFTLQQLAEHFVIPEVPDVATNNPDGYCKNLEVLANLETLTDALSGR